MYMAPTKEEALGAYELFIKTFENKYPKAVECLAKNIDDLFTFYDFPAEHWIHIRSTNAIESTFATLRLRTAKTRGMGNARTAISMVFKLMTEAEKRYAKLKGHKHIPIVMEGRIFKDGELVEQGA